MPEEICKRTGEKMKDFHLNLDYYELLNLHKALLEAKFHMNPDNELVSGSPLVADVYIQVRDLLMQNDESGQWSAWFQLKNRPDIRERALLRMRKNRRWEKASSEEKKKLQKVIWPRLFTENRNSMK